MKGKLTYTQGCIQIGSYTEYREAIVVESLDL
jgi:hypothetical protein